MRWIGRTLLPALCALLMCASVAWSQGPPRIDIQPPSAATGTAVAVRDVLSENPFDGLMRNGFPTNLHFRVEVWTTGRWFDDVVDRVEWDIQVRYNIVDRTYDVVRRAPDGALTSLGSYTRFLDARSASELAFSPQLALPAGRRGYVSVQVDVQSLQISDLAETQRWLAGEARPAVTGRRNPGTALTRGLRTLVTRLLGGEVRHIEKRSAEFQF